MNHVYGGGESPYYKVKLNEPSKCDRCKEEFELDDLFTPDNFYYNGNEKPLNEENYVCKHCYEKLKTDEMTAEYLLQLDPKYIAPKGFDWKIEPTLNSIVLTISKKETVVYFANHESIYWALKDLITYFKTK